MLDSKRLIFFSSRVHTYLMLLTLFFFMAYLSCMFFTAPEGLVSLILFIFRALDFGAVLFGIWVFALSMIHAFESRTADIRILVLLLIRTAALIVMMLAVAVLEGIFTSRIII